MYYGVFGKQYRLVSVIFLGLLFSTTCYSDRGADFRGGAYGEHLNDNEYIGHSPDGINGNYYRGDYYYGGNWGEPAIVVGAPASNCSPVQQCDDDGNCVENQVCE